MPGRWTVTPLVAGTSYSSSCTLLSSGAHRILVDTGLLTREHELLDALTRHQVSPEDITLVVNTHLHIDHCGNNRAFPRADIVLSRAEWQWATDFYAALFAAPAPEQVVAEFYPELADHALSARTIRSVVRLSRLLWREELLGDRSRFLWTEDTSLPPGIEVIPTPGHTPHHLSIAVDSWPPALVAGDAILDRDPGRRVLTMIPFSRRDFEATRQALLDRRLLIVPGHGEPFQPEPGPEPLTAG